MDIKKTITNLEKKRYTVSYFENAKEAADYLDSHIDGKTVGFGDSRTMADMGLYGKLSTHNEVHDPYQSKDNDEFLKIAKKALITDVYLTSVNAMSETGEMVNIDGTGNRIAGSLFGHDKVYFVVSTNKIEPTLEKAMWRARNIAAPKNVMKYSLHTPCVVTGGEKCYDCKNPKRICNAIITYYRRMDDIEDVEIILIDQEMGF